MRDIASIGLSPEKAATYERFTGSHGLFRNHVAVFAHVPAAPRRLMPMLMESRDAATPPTKRYLEIVIVSTLHECHDDVAHLRRS